MMKNARDMYSKKTLNNENHTKTVWKFPQTQAATSLAKSKPATLVKHCCDDLEHRTNLHPYIISLLPTHLHHCTTYVVPLYHLHCAATLPTSYHCTPYIVPLDSLHRTIVPSTSYHCTPYMVPLCPLYRTIVPPTAYHCIYPLHRTIIYHTIAPPTSYQCTRYIVPLRPHIVPLHPLHRTIVPPTSRHCTCITVPLRCLHCTIAPALRTPVPASRTPWQSSHLPRDYLSEQFFWKLITLSLSPKEVWKSNFRVTDLWKPLNPTEKSFTAKRFHSKEASQQRDLTAKRSHSKEISQQRGPAAKKSHSKEIA